MFNLKNKKTNTKLGLAISTSLLALGMMGTANAATVTSNMQVNANVNSSCLIVSASNLDFKSYSTVQHQDIDMTSSIKIQCIAKSPSVRVMLDEGRHASNESSCSNPIRNMVSSEGYKLNYQLYRDSARSQVFGCEDGVNSQSVASSSFTNTTTAVTVTAYGKVFGGQDAAISDTPYVDTIGVIISF